MISKEKIDELMTDLSSFVGSHIKIKESLSDNGIFDRHFTSFSFFIMTLGYVGWRFSGARLTLDGRDTNDGSIKTKDGHLLFCPEASYEINIYAIANIESSKDKIIITEKFPSTSIVRKTQIKKVSL